MSQPMIPPPLPQGYAPPPPPVMPGMAPGYPAPAAGGYPMPAPQAPQGYPGPAVSPPPAPPPAHPPAAPYPAFSQQQPAPQGYAPPAPAPAYGGGYSAPTMGNDIGSAIAAATGGDRSPRFPQGSYLVEVLETIVTKHPVEGYLTFKFRGKVLESSNPAVQVGSEYSYIEGLAYGAGRVQDCLLGSSGFPSKAVFDAACISGGRNPAIELQMLGNAAGDPANPQPGNHYPANPLKGRHVRTVVTEYDKTNGPRSKKPGQISHVHNHVWSPA